MDDVLGDIEMVDFEPESEKRPRSTVKKRARPLEDIQLEEAGKPRPYVYKGVRGGMLLAGYIK
ncbi:MAG TPA: hypothetical protein VFA98_06535 [Thermoanaerobaculia bacterium]|jgi:hypothetical protein|nr:hypothetical protein [Thermoanaerobaculia bacterium]